METLIKGILAQPTLQDRVKSAAIAKLLMGTAGLSTSDVSVLLDLSLQLKSKSTLEDQTGDRILLAVSIAHRDIFRLKFDGNWFESICSAVVTNQDFIRNIPLLITVAKRKEAIALTEEEKQGVEKDMHVLQQFAEKRCISTEPPREYAIQCLFIAMYTSLPDTRPLATASYIEFLVDHLAIMPVSTLPNSQGSAHIARNTINLLKHCWNNGPDNVFMTIPQLFLRLSDDQQECSLGVGYLLQAVPENYTSVVDPFIQNLDVAVLWRLKFTVQRLINWLVTYDMTGIGIWIVAIMESLASRGEYMLLRELADGNAYKIARQLAFKARRNDAFLVLRFMLTGYYHSPVLFHNISKGLIPLIVSCGKSPDDISFATDVCNLAQTLVIHFGDTDNVGTRVQKARLFLELPVVTRAEALRVMQDYSWKKSIQIQNTSAGSLHRQAFVQPLGKVGLVNLGNSCFMNSALRALFCCTEFRQAVLTETLRVDSSKIMTSRLRETFTSLSTSRLSIFTPSALYKALPEWMNDGHQQDAAEFTQILFSRLDDEDPASKRTLQSFLGTVVNKIKCTACGTVSSNKEEFYDLTVPLPRSECTDIRDIQDIVDIFPSVEDLNGENNNMYFCNQCGSLQDAKRVTMLESLPQNLIVSLNRFEFDVQRSQRMKINTPVLLTDSIHMRAQDGHEIQSYLLYAVVIHTGESAHHGHYYTYARDNNAAPGSDGQDSAATTTWLLYNDTSVTVSSFEAMQQALSKSRTDTPYILFFRRMDTQTASGTRRQMNDHTTLSKMTVSNL